MGLPVDNPEYWTDRLMHTKKLGYAIHHAVYNVSVEKWKHVQSVHARILPRLFHPYQKAKILDAGCGYGALLDILPLNIEYTGIDLCPAFISEAKRLHPPLEKPYPVFFSGNLNTIPLPDRYFDICIARSLEGTITENLGYAAWKKVESELLRVSYRLVLLNYTEPETFRIIEPVSDHGASPNCIHTVYEDTSHLSYRAGMDGTLELFDLYVDESTRRQGVASRLVQYVLTLAYGTVYGFCRRSNAPVRGLYQKLGFEIVDLPGFYRGEDAFMVIKPFLKQ